MKYIWIVALALLVGAGLAVACDGPDCISGTGTNYLDQTNDLYAETGYDVDWVPCRFPDIEVGDVTQTAKNCAAVMGAGNDVDQSNELDALGIKMKQDARNAVMVVGTANDIYQSNVGSADSGLADPVYGAHVDQTMKNMLLVLGKKNIVDQTNEVDGGNAVDPDFHFVVDQTAKNIAAVVGQKNDLNQHNDIEGYMLKDIEIDPILTQTADNLALMVGMGKCLEDGCEDEGLAYAAPQYEWPQVQAEKVEIPAVQCPGCFELEECVDADGQPAPCPS